MPRPSTVLVIFVVSMNLFAGAFISMGVMDNIGVDDRVNENDNIPQEQDTDLNTGSGVGGTLFGMYNVLTQQVEGVFSAIFPALDMLERAGVPTAITGIFGGLFTFIIFFDVISYIRGWGV